MHKGPLHRVSPSKRWGEGRGEAPMANKLGGARWLVPWWKSYVIYLIAKRAKRKNEKREKVKYGH